MKEFIFSKVSSAQPATLPKSKLLHISISEGFLSTCARLGVVACNFNPATLDAESQNGIGLVPVAWIVRPPIIQHKTRSLIT